MLVQLLYILHSIQLRAILSPNCNCLSYLVLVESKFLFRLVLAIGVPPLML
jgi:hypothetical protein